ncbi:MAG: hypothetical protein ACYDHY_13170 [Acidiferrobacterales bacterium]
MGGGFSFSATGVTTAVAGYRRAVAKLPRGNAACLAQAIKDFILDQCLTCGGQGVIQMDTPRIDVKTERFSCYGKQNVSENSRVNRNDDRLDARLIKL